MYTAISEIVRYFHLFVESPGSLQVKMQIKRSVLLVTQYVRGPVAIEVVLNNSRKVLSSNKKV